MSANYRAIVKQIANQKPMGRQVARLPLGNYRVTLLSYTVRPSQQGKGAIFEAEFNADGHDGKRLCSWTPEASGWRGEFERSRANEFLTAVRESIGYSGSTEDLADALLGEKQEGRGIVLDVEVSQKFEKDGTPVVTERGDMITDIIWKKVSQTQDQIQASRAVLDGKPAPKAQAQASVLGM